MPADLTNEQLRNAWANSSDERATLANHRAYLEGVQPILDKQGVRRDGTDYHKLIVNWVSDVCGRHVGFLTGKNVSVTVPDDADDDQRRALDNYLKLAQDQSFDAMNSREYLDSLALGYRVEVHGVSTEDSKVTPIVTDYAPETWAFVEDEDGVICAAINEVRLPAGSVFLEEYLDQVKVLWWVYTPEEIIVYDAGNSTDAAGANGEAIPAIVTTSNGANTTSGTALVEIPKLSHEHAYGVIPVFRWNASPDLEPLTDEAFLTLQDAYNALISEHSDDVETDIDALLVFTGIDPKALFEINPETGKTYIATMREEKAFAFPDDGSEAKFLTRNLSVDKVKFTEEWYRAAIHVQGKVPDLQEITGATGSTSGIALRLAFQRMVEFAGEASKYVRDSIKQRIDLINIVWAATDKPQLINYDVQVTLNLPSNDKEATELAMLLKEELSPVDLLRLVPVIEDPASAVDARVQWELDEAERQREVASAAREAIPPEGEIDEDGGVIAVEGTDDETELPPALEEEAEELSEEPGPEALIDVASEDLEESIAEILARGDFPVPDEEELERIIAATLAALGISTGGGA